MHPSDLWDFDDPAGSESRFRAAADEAHGPTRDVLLTQVARALGLQERYDEGHAVLDGLADTAAAEVAVRVQLERGRLHRSSGDLDAALPAFEEAVRRARAAGLDELHVDALHMVALVAPADEQVDRNQAALAYARASADPRARRWAASLLNNIGMAHADSGDFPAALAAFEEALEERRRTGTDGEVRVARWMVAWALRNVGMTDAALEMQLSLKAELESVGEEDPYVDEELEILRPGGS